MATESGKGAAAIRRIREQQRISRGMLRAASNVLQRHRARSQERVDREY